jgi:hypothetical protein
MRHMIIVLGLIGGFVAVATVEASHGATVVRRGAVGYRGGEAAGVRGATVVGRGGVGYRGGEAAGVRGRTMVRRGVTVGR